MDVRVAGKALLYRLAGGEDRLVLRWFSGIGAARCHACYGGPSTVQLGLDKQEPGCCLPVRITSALLRPAWFLLQVGEG